MDLKFDKVLGSLRESDEGEPTAYEIAVAGGFVGTEQEWLDSKIGDSLSSFLLMGA